MINYNTRCEKFILFRYINKIAAGASRGFTNDQRMLRTRINRNIFFETAITTYPKLKESNHILERMEKEKAAKVRVQEMTWSDVPILVTKGNRRH